MCESNTQTHEHQHMHPLVYTSPHWGQATRESEAAAGGLWVRVRNMTEGSERVREGERWGRGADGKLVCVLVCSYE